MTGSCHLAQCPQISSILYIAWVRASFLIIIFLWYSKSELAFSKAVNFFLFSLSLFKDRISLCKRGWLPVWGPSASFSSARIAGMYHHRLFQLLFYMWKIFRVFCKIGNCCNRGPLGCNLSTPGWGWNGTNSRTGLQAAHKFWMNGLCDIYLELLITTKFSRSPHPQAGFLRPLIFGLCSPDHSLAVFQGYCLVSGMGTTVFQPSCWTSLHGIYILW